MKNQAVAPLQPLAAPSALPRVDPQVWKILGVVVLAPFMTQMDSTIVNVSLASIRDDLHSTISAAQWVLSGYLLALALMLPISAWLVDRFGAKRLYLFCFSAFTLASFLCGAAGSMPALVAARVFQGVAGGLLAPLTQFMLASVAGRQIARVAGYATAPVLLAPLLGPPLAGAILHHLSWRWLFYVNLPVGVLAVIAAAIILPHDESMLRKRSFDLTGFLLLSPGLALLLYGFERLAHGGDAYFLSLGVAFVGAFFWRARKMKSAGLIDLDLFKIRTFKVAAITQFLSNGIIYCGQFLIPLYLISGAGLSPSAAGWTLSAMGIGMMCVYPFMGAITDRFGCRDVAAAGVLLNFVGTLPFLWMTAGGFSPTLAIAGLWLRGVGQGATGLPSIAAAYASVPKEQLSFATTSINIVQRLGGPILLTALSIVVSLSLSTHATAPAPQDFRIPFFALIAFQLFVLGSALRLPRFIEINEGEAK